MPPRRSRPLSGLLVCMDISARSRLGHQPRIRQECRLKTCYLASSATHLCPAGAAPGTRDRAQAPLSARVSLPYPRIDALRLTALRKHTFCPFTELRSSTDRKTTLAQLCNRSVCGCIALRRVDLVPRESSIAVASRSEPLPGLRLCGRRRHFKRFQSERARAHGHGPGRRVRAARLPRGCPEATPRLPRGYPEAALE